MATSALDREAVDEAVARGSDLLKQGRLDEAQKAFRTALLADENNPRVLALLGLTYFRAGQFPQAQPIYEELVERAPTDASHRLNLGLVYLKLGDAEKAIGALESSRALDPGQGRAVSYLGLAYARAGRYSEAYRSFLLAGQNELATEIEVNLTQTERDAILAQLGKAPERKTPPPPPRSSGTTGEHATASAPSRDASGSFEVNLDASGIHTPPREEDDAFSQVQAVPGSPAARTPAAVPTIQPGSSESQQFVLPDRAAIPRPHDGHSMISNAVAAAAPSNAATAGAGLRGPGATPAVPLSQLATDGLIRPDDGTEMFEVTPSGSLVIRVVERTITRLEGIHITGGELEFEPATRRSRGSQTDERFDYGGARMHLVSGKGFLVAVCDDKTKFTAVSLDDDIFYLREDLVFAFDATLRWENGNVPGLRGKLPVVQFRGDGAVALRTGGPLVRVKLAPQGVVYINATRLAGWIGRVIPRAVVPPAHGPLGELCVECTGEGVVLVDPTGALPPVEAPKASPPPPPPAKDTPPDWLGDAADESEPKRPSDDEI